LLQVRAPNAEVAGILVAQAAAMPAIEPVGPEKAKIARQTAIQVLEQIQARRCAPLAVQMTGAHNAAVKSLIRAIEDNQTFAGVDANVLRVTRLMRLFNDQLQTFASLKGRPQSKRSLWSMFTCTRAGKRSWGMSRGGRGRGMEIEVRPHRRCPIQERSRRVKHLSAVCQSRTLSRVKTQLGPDVSLTSPAAWNRDVTAATNASVSGGNSGRRGELTFTQ
jgi:hypothetical protein